MNNIPNNEEITKKLEAVSGLITGENVEKNISRLNLFIKKAFDVWFLIDPVTGSVAKGAQIATSAFDDLFNGLSKATQQDIDNVFNEILKDHNEQLSKLNKSLALLIPKASVTYDQNNWSLQGHGISSLTDYSNHEFKINFIDELDDPENYYAHCNVTGSHIEIDSDGVHITLPENFDVRAGTKIKVMLQRMTYDV